MKKILLLVAAVAACASLAMVAGCDDDDDGGGGSVLAKGTKENLSVGVHQQVTTLTVPDVGLIRASVTWPDSRRIRAVLTILGPGTHIADVTSPTKPIGISAAVSPSNTYVFYLGNPDGPGVVDVDYTVTFE